MVKVFCARKNYWHMHQMQESRISWKAMYKKISPTLYHTMYTCHNLFRNIKDRRKLFKANCHTQTNIEHYMHHWAMLLSPDWNKMRMNVKLSFIPILHVCHLHIRFSTWVSYTFITEFVLPMGVFAIWPVPSSLAIFSNSSSPRVERSYLWAINWR